ncbi:MAG: hypothetical protein V4672_11690 [Verrucomicrobiota bacterium]
MKIEPRLPTDRQRRCLCEMLYFALIEIRALNWEGKTQQAADLADAFHNLPIDMWLNDFSFEFFRDSFIAVYQQKYPGERSRDYVAMIDDISKMKG